MQLSDTTIKEFQDAVREDMGIELDKKEARQVLTGLVNYFDLLAKIAHRNGVNKT